MKFIDPLVVFVILNWNQYEDSKGCMESLKKLGYSRVGVVLVDNGSSDGSGRKLNKEFPKISLIKNKENLGFAGGNNVGIKKALELGADYVFVLNNDVVLDKNMLTRMVREMEKDRSIGVLGPQIFYFDEPNKLWFFGANISLPFFETQIWNLNKKKPYKKKVVKDTDLVCGAAMLFRSETLRQVGMFDENFFIYWEDVDLSKRCADAGWKLKVLSSAKMWHKVSSSATAGPKAEYLMARNRFYLCRKYCSGSDFWVHVVPVLLWRKIKSGINAGIRGITYNWWIGVWGIVAYFLGMKKNQGLRFIR